jgi:UDPglucose--hexose-1-phosphate uridylyltransferase
MQKRAYRKADGRRLFLYGTQPHTLPPAGERDAGAAAQPAAPPAAPHLRWHPLRGEWVIYAPHRQERTFMPPEAFCPLCPTRPGRPPTEIPFEDFEVAVFENRFPALVEHHPDSLPEAAQSAPAVGACEVVVYTPQHSGSLATLSPARRELLLRVWIDRYQDLRALPSARTVMPFENRGAAVGVTLHHPHGQVYAYPFVPPVFAQESAAFRQGMDLARLLAMDGGRYVIDEDTAASAVVPPFARFPYEVWVVPRRIHPGPWTFDDAEIASFARALGRVVARYDALFSTAMPYVMALHAAPKGGEARFHFHAEFYPFQRERDRLKYLAGTEIGAGAFTVDVLPEDAADLLRRVRLDPA